MTKVLSTSNCFQYTLLVLTKPISIKNVAVPRLQLQLPIQIIPPPNIRSLKCTPQTFAPRSPKITFRLLIGI